MSFKISDHVVCVDDSRQYELIASSPIRGDYIVKGKQYVIRDVTETHFGPGIRLVGVYGGMHLSGIEGSWAPWRFRKLDELKAESKARSQNALPTRQTPSPFHQEQPINPSAFREIDQQKEKL